MKSPTCLATRAVIWPRPAVADILRKAAEVGRAPGRLKTADPAAEEFHSLKPNRALMEQLARQTGGQVIFASKLDDFAASPAQSARAPVTEDWSYPLWHRSTVFLFALSCFIAEWGLRRWKGMARESCSALTIIALTIAVLASRGSLRAADDRTSVIVVVGASVARKNLAALSTIGPIF